MDLPFHWLVMLTVLPQADSEVLLVAIDTMYWLVRLV